MEVLMKVRDHCTLGALEPGRTFKLKGKFEAWMVVDLTKENSFKDSPVLNSSVTYCVNIDDGIVESFGKELEVEMIILEATEI